MKGEKEAFINNIANSVAFTFSISAYIIIKIFIEPTNNVVLAFPFDIILICFIVIYIPFFIMFMFIEKKKMRKEKILRSKVNQLPPHLPLKYDIYRKMTHLVVLGIIFLYFTPNVFTQDLVVFLVGVSLIGLLTADISRILLPEFYPLKPINQILKKKELYIRLGPHISMSIGCFSVILLFGLIQPFGPIIISTAMAMATLGDIASNLVGRAIGKNKIRNTNKTYEGLFAGIITAFLSGFLVLKILEYVYKLEKIGVILIPVFGSIVIGFIDYLDLEIDDNLSYNIITSVVLFFASIFLF
ncbi:MAG: phosphatidate cytidylyltransferase [Candidatus Thorarchaeota archaeon]